MFREFVGIRRSINRRSLRSKYKRRIRAIERDCTLLATKLFIANVVPTPVLKRDVINKARTDCDYYENYTIGEEKRVYVFTNLGYEMQEGF